MSDKLDVNFTLGNILDYAYPNPRDITYFGIGSAPHTPLDRLDDKWDQIIPKFIVDLFDNTDFTFRIINIDPDFERQMEYMMNYFKSNRWSSTYKLQFEYDNSEGMHIWRTKDHRIEAILICDSFDHTNRWNDKTNDWFLEKFVDVILNQGTKLIVQEYTGQYLDQICKSIYDKSTNKDRFKKNILFDVSYGNDCSCMTDLTVYKPFYDKYGNFHNFTLYNEDEMVEIIGDDEKINSVIKKYFVSKYRKILNDIHVDYRRKLKGEPLMFGHPGYDNSSPPEQIMEVLQNELKKNITIFELLKMITNEKRELIVNLFDKFYEYDVYKWNNEVLSVVRD